MTKDNSVESTITPEATEREAENSVVGFNEYETVCNYENDGSRRRGILSEEMYGEIVADPSTGFIRIGDSLVPALIDIKHGLAMGYDTRRCEKLVGELSSNIRILALPVHEFSDDEKTQLKDLLTSSGGCELYFSDHNGDESSILAEILVDSSLKYVEKPLVDPRAAKGDEQAALYLYSCKAEQTLEWGERKKIRLSDVKDFYEQYVGPNYTPDGGAVTTLHMGDKISDGEAEEMWAIYDAMFAFLGGEDHPISMQDSKEDFFKLLRSENTMISATHKVLEGGSKELTCFSYYIDDVDELYWLNQDFLHKTSDSSPDYFTDIFTPGLVSTGTDRAYAPVSIGFFVNVADAAGLSANVTFENTNLSKRYVPRIVDSSMRRACEHSIVTPSVLLDKVDYRLWSIGGEDE
jgi:hypothetical protein